MDITNLDIRAAQSKGADFDLLHPGTGEKTGVILTVVGYDSDAVDDAAREVARAATKGATKMPTDEFLRARRVAQAKAALMGVKGATGSTTTVDQYRALMEHPGFVWIIEQVENFAGNRGSFFKSAETP